MDFYTITHNLLKNRPPGLSLDKIAKDLKLSYSWVCKFSGGSLENPSYKKLQALHDYLAKLHLKNSK